MSNLGGSGPNKQGLLSIVTQSIILFGSEIWSESMKYEKYRKKIYVVQRRGALKRVTFAYRTVSEPSSTRHRGGNANRFIVIGEEMIERER